MNELLILLIFLYITTGLSAWLHVCWLKNNDLSCYTLPKFGGKKDIFPALTCLSFCVLFGVFSWIFIFIHNKRFLKQVQKIAKEAHYTTGYEKHLISKFKLDNEAS